MIAKPRRCWNRTGSMLVELCASLAAASMVMLLGVTLIERSMHWTESIHRHTNLQRELSQLASTWRDDCAKADKLTFQSEHRVVLSLPGKEVLYEIKDQSVERKCVLMEPNTTKTSTPESFDIGLGYLAQFESPYLVVLAIDPAGQKLGTRLRVLGKTSEKRYRILEGQP